MQKTVVFLVLVVSVLPRMTYPQSPADARRGIRDNKTLQSWERVHRWNPKMPWEILDSLARPASERRGYPPDKELPFKPFTRRNPLPEERFMDKFLPPKVREDERSPMNSASCGGDNNFRVTSGTDVRRAWVDEIRRWHT